MNKKALKQVWNYIKKYRIAMIITLVLAVAIVAMTLYVPIIIGNAIDNIVEAGDVNFVRIKDNIIRPVNSDCFLKRSARRLFGLRYRLQA